MKKKIASILLACMIASTFLAGCGKSSGTATKNKRMAAETTAAAAEAAYDNGGAVYYEETAEYYDSDNLDMSYEKSDMEWEGGNNGSSSNTPDVNADAAKEMLVFRCNIAIDTLEFEQAVTALKTKIEEYHGFVERENQTDGNSSNGRYVLDEKDKDYYYTATIRIPSAYYESFVSAASGIGTLRSKNSSVDNVATRYGTLQSELEIYEAEYERYLKQYNETEDESIALQIQYELRNLAITISDIKTEMSMLESDVAYSYVTITIHKVSEKELKKEEEEKKEVKEEDSFGTKLSKTANESWQGFLGFLQGIVLFFVANWWILLILLLIFGVIFFSIRRAIKKAKIRYEEKRKAEEAQQFERMKAYQMAKEQSSAQIQAKNAENQAQIQARIAAQRAAEQAKIEKAEQLKKEAEESSKAVELKADEKPETEEKTEEAKPESDVSDSVKPEKEDPDEEKTEE
ncbi:MAG: DUF4349 domain-containing protein [Clostridiales bacterium]|nr:DUF4349 domain-containing protein [Clostridiales bacterium]